MVKIQVNNQGKAYYTSSGKVLISNSASVINPLNVTPTTSAQVITAPSGTDGYSPVNVSAVTSSIDANITAGNIKKDVSILGVTGTYEGSGGGSDTVPSYQIVNGALTRRTNTYNLTGTEFSNVTSIASYGLYDAFYNCTGLIGSIDLSNVTSIGNYALNYAFYGCTGITGSIDLSNVTSIGSSGLNYAFNGCTGITGSMDLSSVTSIGNSGLYYAFYNCTGITSVDLSSVTNIGNSGLYNAFYSCSGITSVDLSSVTSIGRNGFAYAFYGCKKLQTINFDSLKTTSFDNVNAFSNMFNSSTGSEATGGCTVHFPSNLQSTISGLTGYPTFGGSSSLITLSFDLPATS